MAKSEGQKQSLKHEKRLAKVVGGQRNVASGAFWFRKGDVRSRLSLWEHKWTSKLYYIFKSAELEKIGKEAIIDSRLPIFAVHMNNTNFVVLNENDYYELRFNLENKDML